MNWRRTRLSLYIIGFTVVYLIPLSFVTSRSFCMFFNLLGAECGGCGFSRAFFSFMNGQFENAWNYNQMVILVPIVLLLVLEDSLVTVFKIKRSSLVEYLIGYVKVVFSY